MRLITVTFWSSNALLLAAGGAFAWTRTVGAEVSPPPPPPTMRIVRFSPEQLSTTSVRPSSKPAPGWIAFGLGRDEKLVGVISTRVFPVDDGVPELGQSVELSSAQVAGRLDTRQWLDREGVPAEVFLSYDLLVRNASGTEEFRQGWARADVISLRTCGVCVDAPSRNSATIDVRTSEGQAIPGALVVVDPLNVPQTGLASQFAQTSEDGTVVISGLPNGAKFRASLPDGVGPDPRAVSAVIEGGGGRQDLRAPLAGKWRFVRHRLHFALQGSSTRVTEFKLGDLASTGAWPVNRWVPPGRGFDAPFWVMLPDSDSSSAVPAHVVFADRDGVDIPDLRTPVRLAFSPMTHGVKIVGKTSASSATPLSLARESSLPR